jgi:hypothetical protein
MSNSRAKETTDQLVIFADTGVGRETTALPGERAPAILFTMMN